MRTDFGILITRCGNILSQRQTVVARAEGTVAVLEKNLSQQRDRIKDLQQALDDWQKVQVLLTAATAYARAQMIHRIELTVTSALHAVVDGSLSFKVEMGERGGQPTARWLIQTQHGDYVHFDSPEEAAGGGIVDIVSFALRLACLELSHPRSHGPLVLDEPGKMISEEYAAAVATVLSRYAQGTGRQVFMVTHNAALAEAADRVITVRNETGVSIVQNGG